jgi:hypothetical protein
VFARGSPSETHAVVGDTRLLWAVGEPAIELRVMKPRRSGCGGGPPDDASRRCRPVSKCPRVWEAVVQRMVCQRAEARADAMSTAATTTQPAVIDAVVADRVRLEELSECVLADDERGGVWVRA